MNLRKTNHRQYNLFSLAPTMCNNPPDSQKVSENLNTYKHLVKRHYLHRMNNDENIIYSYL